MERASTLPVTGPSSKALTTELAPRLAVALTVLPPASVPIQLPAKIVAAFSPLPAELRKLLERWHRDGTGALKARAGEA